MHAALVLLALVGQSPDMVMLGRQPSMVMVDNADLTMIDVASKRPLSLFAPTWCSACGPAKKAVLELSGQFAITVHTDDESFPAWVKEQANKPGWGYPMVHWKTIDGTGKVMLWSGVEQFRQHDTQPATINAEAAPTPGHEVERVIGLLPKPAVGFVDFGCGADARWCVAAAERWGCRVTGVEIDSARAASAKARVKAAGLDHLIAIIEGDATTTDVEADVGVVYLYPQTLEQLRPRLEKLRAFASYRHQPPGLPVTRDGDTWFYAQGVQTVRGAVWGGQYYSQPVCNDPGCNMCNSIRQQLGPSTEQRKRAAQTGITPRQNSVWWSLF